MNARMEILARRVDRVGEILKAKHEDREIFEAWANWKFVHEDLKNMVAVLDLVAGCPNCEGCQTLANRFINFPP